MRIRTRPCLSVVAIIATALHGLLLGLAPLAAAASVDPFTVICHSAPQTAPSNETSDEQSPASPDIVVHGCDHCNLCSAAAPPAALDEVFAGQLVPVRLLHVLRAVSAAANISLATTPKLAQGPPAFA
jgi:hypothetical protein